MPRRSYGPEGMHSCETTGDEGHPEAARHSQRLQWTALAIPPASARLAKSPERASWPVAAKAKPLAAAYCVAEGSLQPNHPVAGVPHNHRLLQHRRPAEQKTQPFHCSLVAQRRAL